MLQLPNFSHFFFNSDLPEVTEQVRQNSAFYVSLASCIGICSSLQGKIHFLIYFFHTIILKWKPYTTDKQHIKTATEKKFCHFVLQAQVNVTG